MFAYNTVLLKVGGSASIGTNAWQDKRLHTAKLCVSNTVAVLEPSLHLGGTRF